MGNVRTALSVDETARKIASSDPAGLARVYAYLVGLNPPPELGSDDEAVLRSSSCWQSQWRARRAIERNYSHFFEVERIWRENDGGGPGWNELPTRR